MYGIAAYWQHEQSQEGPKILGSFFQWILILQLFMDIFARCYPEMTRHWRSLWIVLMGRAHLPIPCLHFDLVILILLKLHGVFFFLLFFKEKGLERHGAWKNHSRHTDTLHPVPHPCSRSQVCWDRQIQYHCSSLNSALSLCALYWILYSSCTLCCSPLSQIQDAGNLHRLWWECWNNYSLALQSSNVISLMTKMINFLSSNTH